MVVIGYIRSDEAVVGVDVVTSACVQGGPALPPFSHPISHSYVLWVRVTKVLHGERDRGQWLGTAKGGKNHNTLKTNHTPTQNCR